MSIQLCKRKAVVEEEQHADEHPRPAKARKVQSSKTSTRTTSTAADKERSTMLMNTIRNHYTSIPTKNERADTPPPDMNEVRKQQYNESWRAMVRDVRQTLQGEQRTIQGMMETLSDDTPLCRRAVPMQKPLGEDLNERTARLQARIRYYRAREEVQDTGLRLQAQLDELLAQQLAAAPTKRRRQDRTTLAG